jgi:hypothetical protein
LYVSLGLSGPIPQVVLIKWVLIAAGHLHSNKDNKWTSHSTQPTSHSTQSQRTIVSPRLTIPSKSVCTTSSRSPKLKQSGDLRHMQRCSYASAIHPLTLEGGGGYL